MNPGDPNVQQVQIVAKALGELRGQLIFVGGCATGLLITDEARPPVRATQDVDLVAEIASKVKYYQLTERLKKLGFVEDAGDVICRWKLGDLMVDVMPTHGDVLNFTNKWYVDAVRAATTETLPDGNSIQLITAPYFVATKLEAFFDRGNGDYSSHDLEDIINVLDGRPSIVDEISAVGGPVKEYLQSELDELISNDAFLRAMPMHFRPDAIDQARVSVVIERLRTIVGI